MIASISYFKVTIPNPMPFIPAIMLIISPIAATCAVSFFIVYIYWAIKKIVKASWAIYIVTLCCMQLFFCFGLWISLIMSLGRIT